MKFLLYSDVHWCQYSSILRGRGENYSIRLQGLIDSMNWAMELAQKAGCTATFCLGDFFDLSGIDAESITALKDVRWANIPHYFICGNHEMALNSHEYSSMKIFNLLHNSMVMDKPTTLQFQDLEVCILPYVLESNRKPLVEYFGNKPETVKRIIFSHNDIAGIQMGPFLSKTGFSIEELEANADKVINGHLHNGEMITSKIFNIGSLSAHNFTNDSFKYSYGVFILDTDTLSIDVFENPYSFNFYKIDATEKDFDFSQLKSNSIISLSCNDVDATDYRNKLAENGNTIESRVVVKFNASNIKAENSNDIKELSVNAEEEFKKFIHENIGTSEIIEEELERVFECL